SRWHVGVTFGRHRWSLPDAGHLHRDPPRPVPREPGRGRDRPHGRRPLRRRGSAGQARRDLHAQGSRRQDGPGAPETRRRRAGRGHRRIGQLMLPEFGQVALVLALLVAMLQAALPLVGAQRGIGAWMATARPAAYAQLVLVALAFGILTEAFVSQDFSVRYVAENSNSLLPMVYRYTAV